MATPVLVVGCRRNASGTETACLLKTAGGYTDQADGAHPTTYDLFARSERIAPAGPGGECLFTALLVAARVIATSFIVQVGGYVDGVPLPFTTLTFVPGTDVPTAFDGYRESQRVELALPYVVDGKELLRTSARGTWFELVVQTTYRTSGTPGAGWLEAVELEYEVMRSDQRGETR